MPPSVLDRAFIRDIFRQTEADEFLIEHPKTGMLMVLVPAGKFLTDTGGHPPFEVDLPAYYVAVHPVTNAQYARFVAETAHCPPDNQVWQESGKMNHPVTDVTWHAARAYCKWAGLRLPTELEWEKAARGLDGRAYPWGKDWDPNRCRNSGNKGGETTAGVWRYGQGGAPFGGLHLSGNVNELCDEHHNRDAYIHYRQGKMAVPFYAQEIVHRGGSFLQSGNYGFASSYRGGYHWDVKYRNLGFRCVVGLGTSP
ncbi:MAG: SUMF1/EgtB/PvdO family nonheme iron enzyme [Verrucomicrobia bacterium]|nr:SUMF1/EgtB/PvdO family nonheme iron enzyme [Verrucomicrobiota bacterium]